MGVVALLLEDARWPVTKGWSNHFSIQEAPTPATQTKHSSSSVSTHESKKDSATATPAQQYPQLRWRGRSCSSNNTMLNTHLLYTKAGRGPLPQPAPTSTFQSIKPCRREQASWWQASLPIRLELTMHPGFIHAGHRLYHFRG